MKRTKEVGFCFFNNDQDFDKRGGLICLSITQTSDLFSSSDFGEASKKPVFFHWSLIEIAT